MALVGQFKSTPLLFNFIYLEWVQTDVIGNMCRVNI